ncbi:MAG: cytochrome c3 family protein [Vicinamibacterales bacterium]
MRKLSLFLFVVAIGLLGSTSVAAQAVAAPGAAATKVGAAKCKMCHKIQFDSWTASKHGLDKAKGAECETCHGNGSGYIALSVMKDPVKAKAAGLIAKPAKAGCATCHKNGVKDEDLPKVHEHKKKT